MNDSGQVGPSEGANTANLVTSTSGEINLVPIPLTAEQVGEWWTRIRESRQQTKRLSEKWDILMKAYLPEVKEGAEDLKAGIHFRNVHTKVPKLFFRSPDLIVTAEGPAKDVTVDPMTGIPVDNVDAAAIKAAVLRQKLGPKGANVKRVIGAAAFDIVAWAGIGCTKIGYKAVIKQIDLPVMQPDPNFQPIEQPGSVLGLGPTPEAPQVPVIGPDGQPVFEPQPVTIFEDWYWDHFSPKRLLRPVELKSTMYDKDASWLGMEFDMPDSVARGTFNIPPEVELKTVATDDYEFKHDDIYAGVKSKGMVHGVEVYYKTSIFDSATQPHPLALRHLVLLECHQDRAYVHRDDPDQTFDELGQLTPDSRIGFPYQIFTNRDLTDSAVPWADNAFTNASVKHINTHRKQSVKLRDANIAKYLYDSGAFTTDELGRIQRGEVGEFIAVEAGKLSAGADKLIAPIVKNEASRDDWRTAQVLKQDVEETLGIGGVNAGSTEDTVRTATEISTSASALADRLEAEQDRILDDYIIGVAKFDSLLCRYATETSYVNWVGRDGMNRLQPWNRDIIAGRWSFTAKPNSQLRIDAVRDRAQTIELVEKLAPFAGIMVNIKPLLRKLALQFGEDPHELILPDMPVVPGMTPGAGPGTPGVPGGPPAPGGSSEPPTGALPNAPTPGKGTPEMERKREVG